MTERVIRSASAAMVVRQANASGGQDVPSQRLKSPGFQVKLAPASEPGAEAVGQLYRSLFDQLVRLSRSRIRNAMDAEDLVQDAFLAVRRAYSDRTVDELRPLLFTTLRNLTLNYLQSGNTRRRQASVELSDMDERLSCPRTVTPETQLIDAELLGIAEKTIAGMAPRRRQALILHRLEHLTYDQIAQHLSVSATTVKTDLASAIAEVAEALARADRQSGDRGAGRK
ncbi:RNA polymerase sigma factor [Hyphomonas sp. GM-8P]|uniref:RNA polymerase sigma factor n=1 Tax=Hyphomonas sp. GM-8P TaxID=1280945 RepID=UPI001313DDC4|nr:sigma-70 family RNA polymerase sigma factor [Hyphomonas sp. GM-8P]